MGPGFAGISVSSSFGNMSQSVGLALGTERIPPTIIPVITALTAQAAIGTRSRLSFAYARKKMAEERSRTESRNVDQGV